jgi:hypothetical protein
VWCVQLKEVLLGSGRSGRNGAATCSDLMLNARVRLRGFCPRVTACLTAEIVASVPMTCSASMSALLIGVTTIAVTIPACEHGSKTQQLERNASPGALPVNTERRLGNGDITGCRNSEPGVEVGEAPIR